MLDAKKINGKKWYLIDHPTKKGSAWIFGKYVKKFHEVHYSKLTPTHILAMQLRVDYGMMPEKTRLLHGKPREILRDGEEKFMELKYDHFSLYYSDEGNNYIWDISIGIDYPEGNFGPIKIGDDVKKLREFFGEDIEEEYKNFWSGMAPTGETIDFCIDENNKIKSMRWAIGRN